MSRHCSYILLLAFGMLLFIGNAKVQAQLSQGGSPMPLPSLQSDRHQKSRVVMPGLSKTFETEEDDMMLLQDLPMEKSLKFAHAFNVSITPENAGNWYTQDGVNIWQVTIESKGAYSINLVFEKFRIPRGARLFVFDEAQNLVLGAFTHQNNKPYKRLGVYPVPGDVLVVQYEEPVVPEFKGEIEIGKVAHAYKDVFSLLNRWNRRTSGSCNVNVNCEFESGLNKEQRSVMRIFATDELGTGTLLNNFRNDGKPYVLSAMHVYDDAKGAEAAVFDFNYESPFCTDLEGYDLQTVAGSKAVAVFDSLDLMLVELNEIPPAAYRPYWAGWDARRIPPAQSWCIHHPNGDTKKISYDKDRCDSTRYSSAYINFGSWRIHNWERGTTEFGSSGAGLFNSDGRMVGALQGGAASCTNISYDIFTRFDKLFDYRKEADKQLKNWLDPDKTGKDQCDGFDYYETRSASCLMLSNFLSDDQHTALSVAGTNGNTNWYTGNNQLGITEVAERFSAIKSGVLSGFAVGIATKFPAQGYGSMVVNIYSGQKLPEYLLKEYRFPMRSILPNAMNYFDLPEPIDIKGTFFIGFLLPEGSDSLVFYHAKNRPVSLNNSLFFNRNGVWQTSEEVLPQVGANMALLVQPNVCAVSFSQKSDSVIDSPPFVKAYPVPAYGELKVEFREWEKQVELQLYDMLGRKVAEHISENSRYTIMPLMGILPGIYSLHAQNGNEHHTQRIVVGVKK